MARGLVIVVESRIRDDITAVSMCELSRMMCRLLAWTMGWMAVAFSETGEGPRKRSRLEGQVHVFGLGHAEWL